MEEKNKQEEYPLVYIPILFVSCACTGGEGIFSRAFMYPDPACVRVFVCMCVPALSSILPVGYGAALFTVFIPYETVQGNGFFKVSFLQKALHS